MFSLVLMPLLISLVSAFPNGAHNNGSNPMDALSSYCTAGNFRPNHGSYLPQASASPYAINVMSPVGAMYTKGKPVTITIEAKASGKGQTSPKIKGFFLQGDSTEAAFSGDIVCGQGIGKKVSFCGKNGVTHTNARPKDSIVCQWSPPDFQLGQIQFTATVVENFTTFWTGIKSEVTLFADPKTMTYQQKAQQLSSQLVRQFQGSAQNMFNMFKQQGNDNPIASLFGGAGAKNGNSNPLGALMSNFNKGGSSNQFATLMGGMGASPQGESSNYWQQLAGGNQQSNSGMDMNNFRQFFGSS